MHHPKDTQRYKRASVLPRGRNSSMNRRLAALVLALVPLGLHAHPHAWIDVRSTIVMSAEGLISAIEEEWLFDDMYSSAILEGLADNGAEKEVAVRDFAAEVIGNLGPYGYFMKVAEDGRPVQIDTVTQFKSEMKGEQLLLSFTAPLARPVDPQHHAVQFSVYDPTYFIRMVHRPDDPPSIKSKEKNHCRVHVEPPNPSPATIARAFALDRGASPDDTLGDLFAEKVHIRCK